KRIAYSTVSQVSYILFGLTLLTPEGVTGALLHLVAHALAKSCLFLGAGIVIYFTLPDSNYHYVDQLRGVGKELPVTLICFGLASLSLVGLPPTGGFVSKWFLGVGALRPQLDRMGTAGLIVLLVSAALTAGYLLPIVTAAFFPGRDYDYTRQFPPSPPANMRAPLVLLAAAAVLTGVFAGPLVRYFERFAAGIL
ncbi:MAG: proton-conducting transporter membrane subunit, partial [Fretibacterium sp.]|nr:proton-conducting transporter membrane subunit [Fretibacterium sp.]